MKKMLENCLKEKKNRQIHLVIDKITKRFHPDQNNNVFLKASLCANGILM